MPSAERGNEPLSSRQVNFVCEKIVKQRFRLGRALGLPQEEIQRQREEDKTRHLTIQDSVAEIIWSWQKHAGEKATLKVMQDALKIVGKEKLASQLQRDDIDIRRQTSSDSGKDDKIKSPRTQSRKILKKAPSFSIDTPERQQVLDGCSDKSIVMINVYGMIGSGKTFLLTSVAKQSFRDCSVVILTEYRYTTAAQLSKDICAKLPSANVNTRKHSVCAKNVVDCVGSFTKRKGLVLIIDLHSFQLSGNPNDIDLVNLLHCFAARTYSRNFTLIVSSNSSLVKESRLIEFKRDMLQIHLSGLSPENSKLLLTSNGLESLPGNCVELLSRMLGGMPRVLKIASELDICSILKVPRKGVDSNLLTHHLHIHGRELVRRISHSCESLNSLQDATCKMSSFQLQLLAATLVFPRCFSAKELRRVVDLDIEVNDTILEELTILKKCDDGDQCDFYGERRFCHDRILRETLLAMVLKKEDLRSVYHNARLAFYGNMLKFIEFLGDCYLGIIKDEHIKGTCDELGEYFVSPVPKDKEISDSYCRWVILNFKYHKYNIEEAIVEGCKFSGLVNDLFETVTAPQTYHLIGKVMLFYQHSRIYDALRAYLRKQPKTTANAVHLAKLKVTMAYYFINLQGFKRYCPKAEDLLNDAKSHYKELTDKIGMNELGVPYADCLSKLGRCIALRGIEEEEEDTFQEGITELMTANAILKDREKFSLTSRILGPLNSYHLGGLWYLNKRYNKAKDHLTVSAQQLKTLLPDMHPILAAVDHRMGCVLMAMSDHNTKRFRTAFTHLQDAHHLRMRFYGNHHEVLRGLVSIGLWYAKNNDVEMQRNTLQKAEVMFNGLLYDLPDAADLFKQLATVHDGMQRTEYLQKANNLEKKFRNLSCPTYFYVRNSHPVHVCNDGFLKAGFMISLTALFALAICQTMASVGVVTYFPWPA